MDTFLAISVHVWCKFGQNGIHEKAYIHGGMMHILMNELHDKFLKICNK